MRIDFIRSDFARDYAIVASVLVHPVHAPNVDPAETVTWCVMYLVREGYVVELPGEWETPAEFCRRIGLKPRRFRRRMKRTKFRPQVDLDCGPSGRLLRLRSNPVFEKWVKK